MRIHWRPLLIGIKRILRRSSSQTPDDSKHSSTFRSMPTVDSTTSWNTRLLWRNPISCASSLVWEFLNMNANSIDRTNSFSSITTWRIQDRVTIKHPFNECWPWWVLLIIFLSIRHVLTTEGLISLDFCLDGDGSFGTSAARTIRWWEWRRSFGDRWLSASVTGWSSMYLRSYQTIHLVQLAETTSTVSDCWSESCARLRSWRRSNLCRFKISVIRQFSLSVDSIHSNFLRLPLHRCSIDLTDTASVLLQPRKLNLSRVVFSTANWFGRSPSRKSFSA